MRGAGYTDRQPADEPGVKTRLVPVEVILAPHGAQFVRRRASRWALSLVVSLTLAAGGLAAQGQEPEEGDASAAADELDEDLLRWLVLRRRWWNALPDAPAPPTVTAAASSSLLVAWTMPEDTVMPVTGYDVECRPDGEALFATWMHAGAATSTTIGSSASFGAITIQSMADLGYAVDTTLAEPYTVPNLSGDPLSLAAETEELPLNCIVHPPTDIDYVTEPLRNTLPASRLDPQIIEVMIE